MHHVTMAARIALFGGSFNPPGLHHRLIAERLASSFDQVRVIPCGPRPDKTSTDQIPAVFRAALADITFADLPRVSVDLFDLEQDSFTRNHQLQSRFESQGQIWHVVGADLVEHGATSASLIHRTWEKGPTLWNTAHFAVLTRPGHTLNPSDLPPNHELIEIDVPGSSTEIRDRVLQNLPIQSLTTPRALAYIERYGLYRSPIPSSWSRAPLAGHPFHLIVDSRNPKAVDLATHLPASVPLHSADFITTIGGDGAMLRTIREHWRQRLPFFGLNAGNLGFLMNAPNEVLDGDFPPSDVIFRQLPMLYLEFIREDGTLITAHGFNDAWLERATSQSAWLEVRVNDVVRIPKLVSDGALVATAAGSTAYARSMGAAPLLADTPAWLLVGSNVMEPASWRSALLSTDATVEMRTLDPDRRPLEAFVDGHSQGLVHSIKARISRAASAELAFCAHHDMAEKIAHIQFHGTNP
jgi:nicotinate (nicotinamide) nucleotide adenylyltransferase